MPESKSLQRTELDPPVRKLKIEADGDFWKSRIKPKIRITGQWLERAGFNPGSHVQVLCVAPGVIELRAPDALTVDRMKPLSQAQPDCPF